MPKKLDTDQELGVIEGAPIEQGSTAWGTLRPPVDSVVEIALANSSLSLSVEELWCAVLVTSVEEQDDGSALILGHYLGGEDEIAGEEAVKELWDTGLHLCQFDPCPSAVNGGIHVTRVRVWKPATFKPPYLTEEGALKLKEAVARFKKKAPPVRRGALRGAGVKAAAKRKAAPKVTPKDTPKVKVDPKVIVVSDDDLDDYEPEEEEDGKTGRLKRGALRKMLQETKQRIFGGRSKEEAEEFGGGARARPSKPAAPRRGLTAGTSLVPHQGAAVALSIPEDTRGTGMKSWVQKLGQKKDCSSVLLAQAVQSAERAAKKRKKDRKESPLEKVVALLKGDRKKKKKKKKKKEGLKKDPDDPGDSSSSGEESSSEDQGGGDEKGEESETSCEPPLKKKASRRPGSVMEMLVRHAQEQLDRGSLLDPGEGDATMTQGVKVATYFALLIRPYFATGSPLLRELYSLAQAIDLLRAGRLPEAADALAARFVAVHTALSEGHWGTASQLELHPLEPTQSTSTATMLQAQKHRKLVWKSQGFVPQRNWGGPGRGKGYQNEKGKKGGGKEKGRNKGRGGYKGNDWQQNGKGEGNPWKDNKEETPKK